MNICVQGLWHLGTVTATCLASVGHDVVGLDFDKSRIRGLQLNKLPISEPGLEELMRAEQEAGRLCFTTSPEEAVSDVELLWVTYDTPVNDNDEADVDFVIEQLALTLPYLASGVTVLISSQMPVGSISRLEIIAQELCPKKVIGFACSPENLRLGKALDIFLNPDRIIVGVRASQDKKRIDALLRPITNSIDWMLVESAEMTKHAINAFLATSVVFANEVASICELVGADAKEVEKGLKSESRIGPKAYLAPGGAFAGGTLARDVEFLKEVSAAKGAAIPLLESISLSNNQHKNWVRRRLSVIFSELKGASIAIWGLTYKPGTDTLRRSLAVEQCDWLLDQGAILKVHDPAVKELPASWNANVIRVAEPLDALVGSSALVIGTEWPEYKDILPEQLSGISQGLVILDANRFVSHLNGVDNVSYVAVGTPTV